ncbi:TAXI family TRAP transporter solute-binding subunit [Tropicimonas marinistellae]|uniref:TAXI family TRAP transporter solute-binding subunit n=1 Tax=Tropicimonas marinistellae TaxID=1739787 RepID=UPI0008301AE0|nr:TAXI family TRAP transporter solute-binding subunit [Tropicimonas marinistellae]
MGTTFGGRFRRWRTTALCSFALIVSFASLPVRAAGPDLSLISIATGNRSGVYYFAGGTICARINAHRWQHGIRCLTQETGGSIDNLRALRTGSATFAIVQSDWHHNAVLGDERFEPVGPDRSLRSVFAIYAEALTVVAGRESGIVRFADLVGKRVNMGPPGSGGRATMEVVMDAVGWEAGDFPALSSLDASDVSDALCEGEIDAAIFTIAHPNLAVEDLLTSCGAQLIPVEGPGITGLVAERPYYFASTISGSTYPNQRDSVPVLALAASLVTTARTSPTEVYELVKAVFDDLPGFQDAHPAFGEFTAAQMVTQGLSAPLHSGALRYFKEKGLQ